jgi:hypothetical protein
MSARPVAGLTVALVSAQIRELIEGVPAAVGRWSSMLSAETIRLPAMSTGSLRTCETESAKRGAETDFGL